MALSSIGTIAAIGPFLEYFRPSRSPYLIVILFGISGIVYLGFSQELIGKWYSISIPLAAVLCMLTYFTLITPNSEIVEQTEKDIEGELKFSRAICISIGILCLILGCEELVDNDMAYSFHYMICLCQVTIFVIYTAVRIKREEPATAATPNHFQIALVTSAYLIGATICVRHADFPWVSDNGQIYDRFLLSTIFFYILWVWCLCYWVKILKETIRISVE